jgi:hypothetical protein
MESWYATIARTCSSTDSRWNPGYRTGIAHSSVAHIAYFVKLPIWWMARIFVPFWGVWAASLGRLCDPKSLSHARKKRQAQTLRAENSARSGQAKRPNKENKNNNKKRKS